MPAFMTDIRKFFLITISAIAIIQIDIFGTFGLVVYGLLIAYGVAFIVVNHRKFAFKKVPISYIVIAYYLYFILANIINGNFTLRGPALVQYLLLTVVAFSIRPIDVIQKDVDAIAKILTVMGLVQSTVSLAMALLAYYCPSLVNSFPQVLADLFYEVKGNFPTRGTGLVQNANLTGGYSFVSAFFSVYLLTRRKENEKWTIPAIINAVLSFYMVFLFTASRTFMLASLSSIFVFCLSYFIFACKGDARRKKAFKIFLAVCLAILIICLIVVMVSSDVRNFILNRVLRIESISDGSGRLSIWKTALKLGEGRRLFGFPVTDLEKACGYSNVHNSILEILSFGGLPCLILFLIYFIYSIYVGIKIMFGFDGMSSRNKILCCFIFSFIVGYFVSGITESDINRLKMTTLLFSMFIGYIHVIKYQLKNNL